MDREQLDKILKEMQDVLNADQDYSKLQSKAITEGLTNDELEVFVRAFDEMKWRIKRIEEMTNRLKGM